MRPHRLSRTASATVHEGHGPRPDYSGLWKPKPDGTATAEVGLFRLIVHPKTPGGHARFLVLRHPENASACRPTLLASGHGDNVEAAMLAAAQTVARLAGNTASWLHTPQAG